MPGETRENLTVGTGTKSRQIAARLLSGKSPGLVWLGGYRSDMAGTKAQAMVEWADKHGHASLRFDYSGHGESGGEFSDGSISRWVEESLAVIDKLAQGPQVLVGSSMGGWIALKLVQALNQGADDRICGLLLVAPAPDFTTALMEPQFSAAQQQALAEKGYFEEPSIYSDEPNIITRKLIEDGKKNQVLQGTIKTKCPVRILQGMQDPDVPYQHALRLVDHLPMEETTITLIKDGDHRLSRPQDIELLCRAFGEMVRLEAGS